MEFYTLQLGPLGANCYIIETAPRQCVAIDIGGDHEYLMDLLMKRCFTLSKILLTHGHFDHIGGVEAVRKATGAEVHIHYRDAKMLTSEELSLHRDMYGEPFSPVTEYTSVLDDSWINDGDMSFRVIHTPGHSEGSVCYLCGDRMFSGDTLFQGSVGRTDFTGSDPLAMVQSLRKIYLLDGDYDVYPGHGGETRLSTEKLSNPYLRRFKGEL
ncbi:MAG: MBL fold metallo-hydrolase [Ruminococcus sp.]|nr:MBL fold metallo-hydrolase [Ruminococcus sp.]